jgi:hypothetical protein
MCREGGYNLLFSPYLHLENIKNRQFIGTMTRGGSRTVDVDFKKNVKIHLHVFKPADSSDRASQVITNHWHFIFIDTVSQFTTTNLLT